MLTSYVERIATKEVTFENSGVDNGVFSIREANSALQEFEKKNGHQSIS
jgi:hypothetical protein